MHCLSVLAHMLTLDIFPQERKTNDNNNNDNNNDDYNYEKEKEITRIERGK